MKTSTFAVAIPTALRCLNAVLGFAGLASVTLAHRQPAQPGAFRTSLIVTVSVRADAASVLDCRTLELRWQAHRDATRYVVSVGTSKTGPWTALPARNECGEGHAAGPTGLIDLQSAHLAGAAGGGSTAVPAPRRRLFYRATAFNGVRAIDSTNVMPIELKPR